MLDIPTAWRAILALDDEGQFNRAATRLGMSQPQLSRLIAGIEKRLGYLLFDRRPYARATPPGKVLIKAVRTTLADLEDANARAERVAAGIGGHIAIGFASSLMATSFPLALQAFSRTYPDIKITLKEMHSSEQEQAIVDGRVDLAVGREASASNQVQSQLLFEDDLIAALSSSHPLALGKTLSVADLSKEAFVVFDRGTAPSLYDLIVGACQSAGFSPRAIHVGKEWHTILALVAAGYGVSLVPRSLGALRWPNLCFRRLDDGGTSVALYLHLPKDGLSPAAALFVKHINTARLIAPAKSLAWQPADVCNE
jgi:DNA-binding transcriptional LysR family regulator